MKSAKSLLNCWHPAIPADATTITKKLRIYRTKSVIFVISIQRIEQSSNFLSPSYEHLGLFSLNIAYIWQI